MRSPMRCSASNRVCSEAHSGRASFEGRDQASLSSLANPKTGVACGPCRGRWRLRARRDWRLSDVCERDQALDLGVAVGQVGVEAR